MLIFVVFCWMLLVLFIFVAGCVRCWLPFVIFHLVLLYFVECCWFVLIVFISLLVVFDYCCFLFISAGVYCILLILFVWCLCSILVVFCSCMLSFAVCGWILLFVVDVVDLFNGCIRFWLFFVYLWCVSFNFVEF